MKRVESAINVTSLKILILLFSHNCIDWAFLEIDIIIIKTDWKLFI